MGSGRKRSSREGGAVIRALAGCAADSGLLILEAQIPYYTMMDDFFKSLITPLPLHIHLLIVSLPARKDMGSVFFTAGSPTARTVSGSCSHSTNTECVHLRACLLCLTELFKVRGGMDSSLCSWGQAQSLAYTCCLINKEKRISE